MRPHVLHSDVVDEYKAAVGIELQHYAEGHQMKFNHFMNSDKRWNVWNARIQSAFYLFFGFDRTKVAFTACARVYKQIRQIFVKDARRDSRVIL